MGEAGTGGPLVGSGSARPDSGPVVRPVPVPRGKHQCVASVTGEPMVEDKVSFVAFLCKVVSFDMQQKSMTDRVEAILEAAIEHLGFTEGSIGMVHELLDPAASLFRRNEE